MELAINTDQLSKIYRGGTLALSSVSLAVPTGCCFGLLGPNGAGKSTLVKALLSIVKPSSGQATLLGRDIRSSEARRGVGYLPEGHNFPSYLSGHAMCKYFGRLSGLRGPELDREIDEKLGLVGMADAAKQKIGRYSKGMKQRVGLAQALLGSPRIIFLDEPTDGVDPVGRQEIRTVIREIADQGMTVFLNSHLLQEVEMVCDKVAILDKGQLLRVGTVEEITAQGDAVPVKFRTSELSESVWSSLDGRGAQRLEEETGFKLSVDKPSETSGIIDELRAAGIEIFAVEPQRTTLEDAFIDLVTDQADGEDGE